MPSQKRAIVVVHSYYLRDTRPRRHATALADAGWDVDVICARDDGEPARERVDGVRIYRLPARRRRGSKGRYIFEYVSFALMALGATTLLWLRRRHRGVYVIGVPNFLIFAALVPRIAGARAVLDMRDPLPEFLQARFGLPPGHPLLAVARLEERASCAFASHVVTVTEHAARLHERSVPRGKVTVVMNAPDPRLFDLPRRRPDEGDRTLVYAGTVGARHGLDAAVRAVAALRDEIPGLRLRIVGDGDAVEPLREVARAHGVHDVVTFEDPLPLDRMPEVMRSAWIGVQPNRPDAFMDLLLPIKVLEWCWLRLPVACGETQPLRDIFTADELMFHSPGDVDGLAKHLLAAHEDPDALAQRAERARATAERYHYDAQIAALLEVMAS